MTRSRGNQSVTVYGTQWVPLEMPEVHLYLTENKVCEQLSEKEQASQFVCLLIQ